MNLRRMNSTVICGMILMFIITVTLITSFNTLTNRSRTLNQNGIKLITLSNDMLHVNDYLIKLMRVFAITHNPTLLDEYNSLLTYDNLDGKLDKMKEIGLTQDEEAQLSELFSFLDKLAEIEATAIDAYNNGDYQKISSIIYSDEYVNTDFMLSNNTSSLISDITNRVNTGVQDIQDRLHIMNLFISIFITLSISCIIALQIMQRRRLLKPIVEIKNIMQDVANGNVNNRLVKKYNDEIGSLFDHVNTTIDSIKAYMDESENSMNILKNILNGIDASIYVTIPDTGEILFINEYMKKHFCIERDCIGELCYKILQEGMNQRCDFCPCFQLDKEPNKSVIWEEHNTVTNRIYQNTDCYIDWLGGIKVHLQHSVDITDIKNIADEKLTAERKTLEMKHEKEKAEASARAKNDFLAKMSHEIRTPMNSVMGMSELILRKNLPQDIYENALGIKSASMNLLSIINDILDFSKIESGMMEIIETEYQFTSLMNDVAGIIRIRLIDKPIQFVMNIDPNIPAVLIGDEVRIRQTIINLLSNAVKYTNEGYISLTLKGAISDNMVALTIDISDSGIGVKKEDMGKLFGDFVQIDTLKNKGVEGTGLGLAISRNLCRMMGGDITLKSEYGVGSTFTITLPQKFSSYVPFASVENPDDKSVLIYETREIYRDSIISTLTNLGVTHESVENIPALFEKLEKYHYVFISSFMYGSIIPTMSKLNNPPKLVLLSDVTESFAARDARILTMPAQSFSIANILNDIYDAHDLVSVTGASFIAPEAKVLIVDDVVANLKVCEGLLMPYEMQLTLCSHAKESVELISSNQYDLVFMDHMMPEMDGLEVTALVRGLEGEYFKTLPIVALTANAVSGVREMFLQNGMSDFLTKPIETAKLDSILEKWIPMSKRKKTTNLEQPEDKNLVVDMLRNVPELSVDKAVSIMGGSQKTYERVVKLSVRLLPQNIARLNELISIDLPNYSIEIHGIKGVLNNLGAYTLGAKAFELEELSKQGEFDLCVALHTDFIDKLTCFSDTMQDLLDSAEKSSEKPTGNISILLEALPQLEEAADFFDSMSAIKVLSSVIKYTYGQKLDNVILSLYDAFERFDYDEALELVEQLKGELGE